MPHNASTKRICEALHDLDFCRSINHASGHACATRQLRAYRDRSNGPVRHRRRANQTVKITRYATTTLEETTANPAEVDKIRQFAHENKLQMLERGDEVQRCTVTLARTAAAMEKAFSLELTEYEYALGPIAG